MTRKLVVEEVSTRASLAPMFRAYSSKTVHVQDNDLYVPRVQHIYPQRTFFALLGAREHAATQLSGGGASMRAVSFGS